MENVIRLVTKFREAIDIARGDDAFLTDLCLWKLL